ncbi:probable transcription factor At3g04930 [Magnolia sinica]|uniref:probable transcription factor At3g04930 n=1 Tax=Magnolia sinica TaxID=86752 RepID=UPI0026584052|nr:probable transcription factor At3g04930 [Magnolia sinica]
MPEEEDQNVYEEEDEDDDSEEEDEDEEVAAQFETRQSRRIEDEEELEEDDDDEEEDLNSASPSSSSSDENPKNPDPNPAPNPNPKNPVAAPSSTAAPPQNGSVGNPLPPPQANIAAAAEAASAAAAAADGDGDGDSSPDRKRLCTEEKKMGMVVAPSEDSRRLFQRLWTDEDEIKLLQGFLDFIQQRGGGGGSHHHDTGPFYDQIKTRLQLDFNKSQLVEKLRRLKKKYRNIINKIGSGKEFSFKRAHDQATFEISRKIWSIDAAGAASAAIGDDEDGNGIVNNAADHSDKKGSRSRRRSRKRSTPEVVGVAEDPAPNFAPPPVAAVPQASAPPASAPVMVPNVVEDTVRSCLSPLFKELLHCAINGPCNSSLGGVALNPLPLNFSGGSLNISSTEAVDDRWRKQQILELEVYSKRLELVQEQIKMALEDLKSMDN